MFKLILIVTVIATGQTDSYTHRDSPFQTVEACFSAAAASDAVTRQFFAERAGSPVSTSYQCDPVQQGSSLREDRAADEIARVLREMNRRGGLAAAPNHTGL